MFHRTNLTLSARTLSNRLNLGTRSFALIADVKDNGQTLRTRRTHHDVMRDGMAWYPVSPISPVVCGLPTIPGSFSRPQQGQPGCQLRQPGPEAADVRVVTEPRPADLDGRPEWCFSVGIAGTPPAAVVVHERGSHRSESSSGRRIAAKAPGRVGLKRPARFAARKAGAAIPAAAIGK